MPPAAPSPLPGFRLFGLCVETPPHTPSPLLKPIPFLEGPSCPWTPLAKGACVAAESRYLEMRTSLEWKPASGTDMGGTFLRVGPSSAEPRRTLRGGAGSPPGLWPGGPLGPRASTSSLRCLHINPGQSSPISTEGDKSSSPGSAHHQPLLFSVGFLWLRGSPAGRCGGTLSASGRWG